MVMVYSLDERKKRACALRAQGYNCAQCVILAFDDIIPPERVGPVTLAAQGFGSGVGAKGYICGAISGAAMVLGALGQQERPALNRKVGGLIDRFKEKEGAVNCCDLKVPGRKPCIELITDTVEMLHQQLEEDV